MNLHESELLLPYEKSVRFGMESLTDIELLSIIIRNGTKEKNCLELAEEIIKLSGNKGLLGLKHLTVTDYMSIKGIGKVKAIMLQCIGELSGRIAKSAVGNKPKFSTSYKAAEYCMEELRHLEYECVMIFCLNTKCELISERKIAIGSVNSTAITARDIFKYALSQGAVYIIIAHNHPSGDPTPSKEDLISTEEIKRAGDIIGVKLLDHIIIGDRKYISFKEEQII